MSAARLVAEYLSRALGQQVFVENRTGANGNIGIEAAAKSAPDGYTVLIAPDAVASNPHVYKVSFDALKDLTPVIQLSRQPIVLAVHPSLGVNSLAELVALAKQRAGPELRAPAAASARSSTWSRSGSRSSPASSSSRCPIAAAGRRSTI